MIHPDTELRSINQEKGRGIVATSFIAKGTMTYVKDDLEIEIEPDDPRLEDPELAPLIDTYSYIDERGVRILSWDHAKYVNHCCQCNTMSTGYGFEVAIRDIQPGEEITDEYGLFNFDEALTLQCNKPGCRKIVNGKDIDTYYTEWDRKIQAALQHFNTVDQPLEPFLAPSISKAVAHYLKTGKSYQSVYNLKYDSDLACTEKQ